MKTTIVDITIVLTLTTRQYNSISIEHTVFKTETSSSPDSKIYHITFHTLENFNHFVFVHQQFI